MGTHPNAILQLNLTPDDGSRKTFRAIADEAGVEIDEGSISLKIGGDSYIATVMEEDYDQDGYQVAAKEGDIIVFDMVTYGYGEQITWEKLVAQQAALAEWAKGICERHKCSAAYLVTANYW